MTIQLLVFASLSEELGLSKTDLAAENCQTALDVWHSISDRAPDAGIRVAINQQYADFSNAVKDGDEIAFFPPVTGG